MNTPEVRRAWRKTEHGKIHSRVEAVTKNRLAAWVRANHPEVARDIREAVWEEHGGRLQRPSAPGSTSGYIDER